MKTQTTQHTPGPWAISQYRSPVSFRAEIYQVGGASETVAVVSDHLSHLEIDALSANAALISAAPDMLAALRYVIDWKEGSAWDADTARAMVKAAIAKAEGHA